MANQIDTAKRNEMRELYLEHRTVTAVASLAGVDWRTADSYRVLDGWDKLLARVDRIAEEIAVKKVAKRKADNIRIAQAALVKMAKNLDRRDEINFNASDADKLVRLVEFLSGDPDSRVRNEHTGADGSPISVSGPVFVLPDNGSVRKRAQQPDPDPDPDPALEVDEPNAGADATD